MMCRFLVRVFVALALLGPAVANAGYGFDPHCWATLSEAAGAYVKVFWSSTGGGRILSYTPVSGYTQVIVNNSVGGFTIRQCETVNTNDLFGGSPMPWYGSDPGTVSACGSQVQTQGGVSGSGSSGGVMSLAGWSMTAEEGVQIGVAIAGLFALAAVFRQLTRVGGSEKDEE